MASGDLKPMTSGAPIRKLFGERRRDIAWIKAIAAGEAPKSAQESS